MRAICIGSLTAMALCTAASAGFVGWRGFSETRGAYTTLDVFASMTSPTDRLLNVFNSTITTSLTFRQASGAALNKWRPALGLNSMTDDDSFVTLGGYSDGGVYYAGDNTTADPNFSNYATSNATTIVPGAGWYTSDPTSPQSLAIDLSGFTSGSSGAGGQYGVWVAHFSVLTSTLAPDLNPVNFVASGSFNTGTSLTFSNQLFIYGPAPGALALLAVAGLAGGLRRR